MKKRTLTLLAGLLAFSLACNVAGVTIATETPTSYPTIQASPVLFFPTAVPALNNPPPVAGTTAPDQGTAVPPTDTSPPPTVAATPCAYTWAHQNLPDLSTQFNEALTQAGLTATSASAQAYGENCVDDQGNVISFSAMETDFAITLTLPPNTHDEEALGSLVEKILSALGNFPISETPGPNAGTVDVTLLSGDQHYELRFLQSKGQDALAQGLTGSALYEALKNSQ